MAETEIKISLIGTDLFDDILKLLKKISEKDPYVLKELAEIMSKHDTEYDYEVTEQ